MALMANHIEAILSFWFDPYAKRHWFKSTDEFDASIRRSFETICLSLAVMDKPNIDAPEEGLAAIICLDQFSRNMYRDTSASFAWDSKAVYIAQIMVDKSWDVKLPQEQRHFIYLPFMHAEDLELQNLCVDLIDRRMGNEEILKHAYNHKNIIEEFGRFPHRNKILGRESTSQEKHFLSKWDGF